MKICIDGLGTSSLRGTGLYTYTFELLNNLFEFYPQPQYKIIWDNHCQAPTWKESNTREFINPEIDRASNNYSRLEEYIQHNKIDIYHSPNNGLSMPGNRACKFIITVHDILPVIKEEYVDDKYKEKFKNIFPKSIKSADKVIAVSDHIRNQIIDRYKIDENDVKLIYPGCSKQFAPMEKTNCRDMIKNKYGIEGDYILYAGSIHIRKNLNMLLEAFRRIVKHKNNIKLVIAGKCDGKRHEYYMKLKETCEHMGINDNILFLDIVDYNYMPALYNCSVCAVNLSSYEGFPMTTVEAMACGTPAVCLRTSLFKEIAGDGGVLVRDEDELKDELSEIIKGTSYRNKIIEKGIRQSKRYTWENHINSLVKVYEAAVY